MANLLFGNERQLAAQRTLRPYVVAMLGEDLASDAMQQVLITIFRKLHTLKEPRAYWAWARRVASRIVMASLGARRRGGAGA